MVSVGCLTGAGVRCRCGCNQNFTIQVSTHAKDLESCNVAQLLGRPPSGRPMDYEDDEFEQDDEETYEDEFESDEEQTHTPNKKNTPQTKENIVVQPTTQLAQPIAPLSSTQKALRKRREERSQEIRQKIKLQDASFVIFDSPPLSTYELSRLSVRLRSKASQTRDDDVDADTQTEPIDDNDQACQVPDDMASAGRISLQTKSAHSAEDAIPNWARFIKFFRKASCLVEKLCIENVLADSGGPSALEGGDTHSLSSRCTKLELPSELGRRGTVDVALCADASTLLAAFSAPEKSSSMSGNATARRVASGSILASWSLARLCTLGSENGATAETILRVLGQVTCCSLVHACNSMIAIAGTAEGSIQVWDLRERQSLHEALTTSCGALSIRTPTYCSDGAPLGSSHVAPVVAICAVGTRRFTHTTGATLVTVDELGNLAVWQIVEGEALSVGKATSKGVGEYNASTASDFGQAVRGRIRLIKSAVLSTNTSGRSLPGTVIPDSLICKRALCLRPVPSDESRLLLGTDTGDILSISRFGGAPPPIRYSPAGLECSAVKMLSFSPHSPEYFLALRADGSATLYFLDSPRPLLSYQLNCTDTNSIEHIAWSPSRPSIFFALETSGLLKAFDLTQKCESVGSIAPGQVSSAVKDGCKRSQFFSIQARPLHRGQHATYVALSTPTAVELHLLKDVNVESRPDEHVKFETFLHKL